MVDCALKFENDDIAKGIVEEAQRRVEILHPDEVVAKMDEMVTKVADEAMEAIQVDKRNTYLNQRAQIAAYRGITENWDSDLGEGIQALYSGTEVGRKGGRNSIAATQGGLLNRYVDGFLSELETKDVLPILARGDHDLAIRKAMVEMGKDEPNLKNIDPDVVEVARIIKKYNDLMRTEANLAGANIGKIDGYAIKQAHDMRRIRNAGFDQWVADVDQFLDYQKTFAGITKADARKVLSQIYDGLQSGQHISYSQPKSTGLKGIGNIGKKMSHERVLHFKDAEAEHAYAQKYGVGALRDTMVNSLNTMAQNTGLMQRMGPNAELNRDAVISLIRKKLSQESRHQDLVKFDRKVKTLNRTTWPNLDGTARIPGNEIWANRNRVVRDIQNMSKLGSAVLSAMTDMPLVSSELRFQGMSAFEGINRQFKELLSGRTKSERKQILSMMGVGYQGLSGSALSRIDIARDGAPGAISRMTEKFFKLNGLTGWTDKLRTAATFSMARNMFDNKGKGFSKLHPQTRAILEKFDIDEGQWNIIRSTKGVESQGEKFLVPEDVNDLPDSAFELYIAGRGQKITKLRTQEVRKEIVNNFRNYYFDRSTVAVLEPNTRTRSTMLRGTQPGDLQGEMLRHLSQFKSFPASIVQRVIKREIYGRGTDTTLGKALKNGKGNVTGLVQLIAWNTLFGYAAMSLKDLAKGKEPRGMNDENWGKVLVAAFAQGGAIGLYADFLFGQAKTRYGGGPLETLAGPTAGAAISIYDVYAKAINGDPAGGELLRAIYRNVPGNNLFYTKLATDYLIFNSLAEMASPGYLNRTIKRAKSQNDQEYFLPPSAAFGTR